MASQVTTTFAADKMGKIARDLEKIASGQCRFSLHDRMLYATDASIYQVEPLGVVLPRNIDTAVNVLVYCSQNVVPVLPRGGGTSLPGQCTNRAVVVDYSPNCRRVLGVDRGMGRCHVEPGITVDELNRYLDGAKTGLFFAPDPATAAQACIGGCIGNNAAGARSIRYGRTSENVAGVEVQLARADVGVQGRLWLGELPAGKAVERSMWEGRKLLGRQVAAVVEKYATLIRERFPKTKRRNAGYALDSVLAQLDGGVKPEDVDLTGLICGSEGTLGMVLGAHLKLHPVPKSKGLAILSFTTVADAIEAVVPILETGPSAVELLDDVVLDAARGNAECRTYMDLIAEINGKPPAAILYVEYQEMGGVEELEARRGRLERVLPEVAHRWYADKGNQARAWALRKAGEPLLHGLAGDRKPVTCVEDNAVPVENLSRFVREFKEIIARHGTTAAYYAHASVGVLHVRPLLNLHAEGDRERLRAIAQEVAELARACGGVMSGEHGDGRLRGPLLAQYYGPELMEAFRDIKRVFDPQGIFNPGMIGYAGPVASITQHLRVLPDEHTVLRWPEGETYFDFTTGHSGSGLEATAETCSGAGVCRKTTGGGGVMCPSYRGTLDERHSPRGRSNALRLALSGQLSGKPSWNDAETLKTLEWCLSCKACKTECPSNVDVAQLKAEYTAQHYREAGVPWSAWFFGHIRTANRLGAMMPEVSGQLLRFMPVRKVLDKWLGLASERELPVPRGSLYRWYAQRQACGDGMGGDRPKVVLFADCFVTYNEPEIGQDAIRILETLGYVVLLPNVGCCGRAMISNGMLKQAIEAADRVLGQLERYIRDPKVVGILVCEPSCLSAMRDDWLDLKLKTPKVLREQLAKKAMMVEDFVEGNWDQHPQKPRLKTREEPSLGVVYHGHCHQKALWGQQRVEALLRRLAGDEVKILPSGCCGMAGAFGYRKKNYELSMKIGEESLFKLLREVPAEARVLAAGTSCRQQIRDGTKRQACHPIQLLAEYLELGTK